MPTEADANGRARQVNGHAHGLEHQRRPQFARRAGRTGADRYAGQIERAFQFFPREQVKIIKFEDFRDKNRKTLDEIFRFLGVKPLTWLRNKDRNVVPYERAITHRERKQVQEIFAEDIAKLEQMLGWNCSDWKL